MSLAIKRDGRFSGTYVPAGNTQFLHFSGVLMSDQVRGVGVVNGNTRGYVLIGDSPEEGGSNSGSSGVISMVAESNPTSQAASWAAQISGTSYTAPLKISQTLPVPVIVRPPTDTGTDSERQFRR